MFRLQTFLLSILFFISVCSALQTNSISNSDEVCLVPRDPDVKQAFKLAKQAVHDKKVPAAVTAASTNAPALNRLVAKIGGSLDALLLKLNDSQTISKIATSQDTKCT
jgi:hypothetical protein